MPRQPEPLWTVKQLATAWHVSRGHIYGLVRARLLAAERLGPRGIRIRESAANAYLRRSTSPKPRHLRLVA